MTSPQNTNLKPCPFCGGEARFEECDGVIKGDIRWSVGCHLDEGGHCHGYQSLNTYATKAEAFKAWNTRTEYEALKAVAEKMAEALDFYGIEWDEQEVWNSSDLYIIEGVPSKCLCDDKGKTARDALQSYTELMEKR